MTRPKPKTVRAWGFAWRGSSGCGNVVAAATRSRARSVRMTYSQTVTVGPVVRIEVPAPKERKR